MSKITVTTIAGLTSGGDANTVKIESGDAFNVVSGATTLGGDLTVDTTTLKVDASNNKVGIGTASPEETLEVVHATAPAIQLNRTNDGGFKSILRQQGNDFEIRGSSGSTKIYTGNADGDSSTARLSINASGQISTPNVPAFSVRASPTYNGTFRSFGDILHNNGSHYDNSNGKFTAPIAGRYFFTCTLWPTSGNLDNSNSYLVFYINNTEHLGGHVRSEYHAITISSVINLSANDTVDIRKNGSWTLQGSTPRNHFSGFLIG